MGHTIGSGTGSIENDTMLTIPEAHSRWSRKIQYLGATMVGLGIGAEIVETLVDVDTNSTALGITLGLMYAGATTAFAGIVAESRQENKPNS